MRACVVSSNGKRRSGRKQRAPRWGYGWSLLAKEMPLRGANMSSAASVALRAVIYAAKSTADVRGSIGTQIADCERALERAGRELAGEPFADEGFSAFKGN